MFPAAGSTIPVEAWRGLPDRSSSFKDKDNRQCTASVLSYSNGRRTWLYDGWEKDLGDNKSVFCEAGNRSSDRQHVLVSVHASRHHLHDFCHNRARNGKHFVCHLFCRVLLVGASRQALQLVLLSHD